MDVVLQPLLVRTRPWRKVSPDRRAWARHCLELVGASALAEKRIGALSGGQLQRVLIARAIAAEPRVLLLDEPTVGIDVQGQKKFGEMLEVVRSELGITVVVVSHELATIAATSDRVACLRRTLHFHDAPRGLTAEVLSEVFSHDLAVLEGHAPACAHDHGGGRGGCGCADEEPGDTKGEGPSEGAGS
jgi:zinc transport system ATP-binding protein